MMFKMPSPSTSTWARVLVLLFFVSACSASRLQANSISTENEVDSSRVWHSKWEYLKAIKLPGSSVLQGGVSAELESCEENYGFFPCSTTVGGNLFLLLIYGYLLLRAAQCLSQGSELLLLVSNPGIIGGLVLPILGALPDALLIMVSGLSASAAEAQSEVLVGMGLLAGSNIMLLTALWGGCLAVGRCDLIHRRGESVAKDKTLTKGWSLTETGVTTDQQTRVASWIMIVTVLPYLIAQTPRIFGWSKETGHLFVLAAAVICLLGLACYCGYQVSYPWIQQRSIYKAQQKVRRSRYLHGLQEYSSKKSWGSLLESDGVTPNKEVLGRLFEHFDDNNDELLSKAELRGLITGLGLEHQGEIPNDEEVTTWITDFDSSHDDHVSKPEFVKGMSIWMQSILTAPKKPKAKKKPSSSGRTETQNGGGDEANNQEEKPHLFGRSRKDAENSLEALMDDQGDDDDDEEGETAPPTKKQVITKAVLYLVVGAVIAGVVADPLVDAVKNFSNVTGISPFFISFVATPLATNSSEAISSLLFAMKRKRKNISLTYSQIYGGVTMNNTMCLAIFLAIVYLRGLTWDFSSEVLVILVATVVIGALASVRVTFTLWMAIVAVLLYPFSIALVAVLDYGFGWQ